MKKIIIFVILTILLVGCKNETPEPILSNEGMETVITEEIIFETIIEEDVVEEQSINKYVDDEYLKELQFNSQKNNF